VDEELLLRNEYRVTASRILHQQIQGRVRLSDEVHVAGVTPHPNERWMMQNVWNATTAN